MVFDEDRAEALPQSCTLCQDPNAPEAAADRRRRWGCDRELEPAEFQQLLETEPNAALQFAPCFRCGGRDPACRICSGANQWDLRRCPYAVVEPWHREVCLATLRLENGILPVAGGFEAQPFDFAIGSRIVQSEIGALREQARQQAQDKATRGLKGG